jgi:hypothetical protein
MHVPRLAAGVVELARVRACGHELQAALRAFVLGRHMQGGLPAGIPQGGVRAGLNQPTNDAGVAVARGEV